MNLEVSHFAAFLLGVATGAAGHYFGEKYSDRRREHEAKKEESRRFLELARLMDGLLKEMRNDLESDKSGVVREFSVLPNPKVLVGGGAGAHFRYFHSAHENLQAKLDLLMDGGFIVDIQTGRTQKFRMTEDFVKHLRKWHPRTGI